MLSSEKLFDKSARNSDSSSRKKCFKRERNKKEKERERERERERGKEGN